MKNSYSYENYKVARNKAWEIIIKCGISEFPVDILEILDKLKIRYATYNKVPKIIETHGLESFTINNDGLALLMHGKYLVLYDDTITPTERSHFTLAHELGHIVLGHLDFDNAACRNGITVWNRDIKKEPSPEETAANIFASRLLAPACVLHKLNIHTAEEIAKLCGLSMTAAEIRAKRMAELYEREKEWLKTRGYSCFGISWQEKAALKQFEEFIINRK